MRGWLMIEVDMPEDLKHGKMVDPERVAERLFNFMADDEDDLFPEIESVDTYEWKPGA